MNIATLLGAAVLAVAVHVAWQSNVSAQLMQSTDDAKELPNATLACKVKMGAITETEKGSPNGTMCRATCVVISPLKGEIVGEAPIAFRRGGNGFIGPDVKEGLTYLVMLNGDRPPYEIFAAMNAVDQVVEPKYGPKPGDRLLAEMMAIWKSKDKTLHIPAIRQIGIMRDVRGSEAVNAAAEDRDAATSRAGVIAQYRMKIAPDAKRLMDLFNEEIMHVWYQESGIPQKDPMGKDIWRVEGNLRFWERGVADFDYATYVREGIKHDWVRKDDHALYVFFGVPWKVQRKACVPELVKLLEDPDQRVRSWAVTCLTHTVEQKDRGPSTGDEGQEKAEVEKWKTWWKEKGLAYMAGPKRPPADG
ncbi:MAG TPA: HEAT repeat domain-containing protein [Pirellulales bacterium]|jgi:hypothetical protein